MTLNLNVLRREVFDSVGRLSEAYTGNFNDFDLSIRLLDKRLGTFLVNAYAHYYGSLTARFELKVRYDADSKAFFDNYPHLWIPVG